MGWVAAASALSGVIGGAASMDAASQQSGAAMHASNVQEGMFERINQQAQPYRQSGYNALTSLGQYAGTDERGSGTPDSTYGTLLHNFTAKDLNDNLAPNYAFMRDQGIGATRNALNARGGDISGNTLQGITKFAEDYAGNAYQQAFSNYTSNQTNIFNRLSAIAGLGQTANAATGTAGTTLAGNAGTALMKAGTAQAGGIVGASNAVTGGLTDAAASWYGYKNSGGGGGDLDV